MSKDMIFLLGFIFCVWLALDAVVGKKYVQALVTNILSM